MKPIKTQRLLLRPLKWKDTLDYFEYAKDEKVGKNAGWKPVKTLPEAISVLGNIKTLGSSLAIEYEGKMIGTVSLFDDDKRVGLRAKMIGYSLNSNYWGKGIATEAAKAVISNAFLTTNIDTIAGYSFPDNDKSVNVLKKCGLNYEGRLNYAYPQYDGTSQPLLCFLITREEFKKNPY